MDKETKKEFLDARELMEEITEDRSVPRNIRKAVSDAIEKTSGELTAMKCSEALYILDDISNDINIPSHTRTEIWEIISKLEGVKEKIK